jgi:pyruvate,orthophosphate dikinase
MVYAGVVDTVEASLSGDFKTLMDWADDARRMMIRTNADTPRDAATALKFGAEGIGLCRTEHMFFETNRILQVRKMICADTLEQREKALDNILPMQKQDFVEIFTAMDGKPVTIRLLDPPLHEFLPQEEKDIEQIAGELGITIEKLKARINSLQEFNPMLGHRGCRLAITYPEIAVMQTKAIVSAAIEAQKAGVKVLPEIMVPLAGNKKELDYVCDIIKKTASEVFEKEKTEIKYMLGTMIEIPRAALTSDEMAQTAEFFSFGTNDLTQMTLGFSRDDAGSFINDYLDKHILDADPFQTVDQVGVGKLIKMSVHDGRSVKSNLKCGVCGEHGGDPASIMFFDSVGLDYVSCSPYRVPIARLAAAQATIEHSKK